MLRAVEPLAARMRPRTLAEFVGQEHLLGGPDDVERPLLRRMIDAGTMTSILLHGPPGTGKTTLARVIANQTKRHFIAENAARIGVARIREIVTEASHRLESSQRRTILFLDEIHRFNKAQQDVLLEDVERGRLTLVGATTENPSFTVNAALVSRSTLFRLHSLEERHIVRIVQAAATDAERGWGALQLTIDDDALRHWAAMSDGDARRALNALEVAVLSSPAIDVSQNGAVEQRGPLHIDLAAAQDSIQHKAVVYDRAGDGHYDHASALIKSIRGCDPDAAVYWLALMLDAGEDPRFIARRLAILASEDIGNADPRAISVADAAWSLLERIGMPEARITLSQCVTYLALAPKSNASYVAIDEAARDVRDGRTQPVPRYLRDGGYEYTHDSERRTAIGGVSEQTYLGVDARYYRPGAVGAERLLAERLEEVRRARGLSGPAAADGSKEGGAESQ
jgi:putative ATPase